MTNPYPHPTFEPNDFRKASRSEPNQDCVQVARRDGWVEIRDDKTTFGSPEDHRLVLTGEQFDAFLNSTHARRADRQLLQINRHDDGSYAFHHAGTMLNFSEDEINAFLDGVTRGEFSAVDFSQT